MLDLRLSRWLNIDSNQVKNVTKSCSYMMLMLITSNNQLLFKCYGTWMTTFSTNPYFIMFQHLECYTTNVDSLFTNVPLKETINICTNRLYNNVDVIEGINKSEFENFLILATQELYFMLNDILYKQKDGVARGSSLERTMTNVF